MIDFKLIKIKFFVIELLNNFISYNDIFKIIYSCGGIECNLLFF